MTGQSKIELILELKNRIGGGLSQAKSQINTEVNNAQARLNDFSTKSRKGFDSVSQGLPSIKSGLSSIINPAMIATAGIGALTAGLMKATDRAAEFNHEFRDLANLNLDKSQREIEDLRRMVLDTSWRNGFDAQKTSNAYNELQSTAGIYGAQARPIVEKQGDFALLMKTSMDDYVAGTAKAMANWKFGVDKLDDFNKSNYAAMQVGVVSFEELAKVQSTFAGSAASINQSFDTANKLFSIFTVKTKSVDEAATLTKSLFNDLTKAQTVKAFKSIGIDLFDSNKQLKQADNIMLELNDKFRLMKNDKAVVSLKNQFKGSEGLIAMIQAATDRTGELRNMLNEFQDSKFNADMALSQAHNDIIHRQEKLANRVDNLMIRLGQTLLPAKEWLVGMAEEAVTRINWNLKSTNEKTDAVYSAQKTGVYEQFGKVLSDVPNMTDAQYKANIDFLKGRADLYQQTYDQKSESYRNVGFFGTPVISHFKGFEDKMQRLDERNNFDRQQDKGRSIAYRSLMHDLNQAWSNRNNIAPSDKTADDNGSGALGSGSGLSDSLNRVVGAASAPRSITINIDSFNKGGINTQNTSLQNMDATQIENWFTDMCMRVVNNVELSYN